MRMSRHKVGSVVLVVWLVVMVTIVYEDIWNNRFGILQLLLGDSHSHHGTMQSPGVRTVHVCLTSDSNTLIGTIATINSVRLHANHPVMFHLVTDSADTANHLKNWIESTELRAITYELRVFDHELVQDKIRVRTGRQELAKPMNYARFYYADIFPKLNGRVIHLDDDVIVQGDVYDLAHTHLKSDHVAAFSDDCTSNNKRFTYLINKYSSYLNFRLAAIKSLHLDPNACSFNTGVYVVDIDLWRKLNITKQLEYWMTLNTMDDIYGNERAGGGSQPPVMIVLYNRYSLLDPLWHVRHLGMTPSRRYGDHFIQHAKLLHWNGRYKPWDGVAMFSDIWDLYFLHDPRGKYVPVRRTLIQNKKE